MKPYLLEYSFPAAVFLHWQVFLSVRKGIDLLVGSSPFSLGTWLSLFHSLCLQSLGKINSGSSLIYLSLIYHSLTSYIKVSLPGLINHRISQRLAWSLSPKREYILTIWSLGNIAKKIKVLKFLWLSQVSRFQNLLLPCDLKMIIIILVNYHLSKDVYKVLSHFDLLIQTLYKV